MLAELREGWTYVRSTTWLWVVVAAFALLNAMQTGAIQTLAPAFAKDTIGVRGWGLAESAEAVGMLLMTVVLLRATYRRPLRAGMLGMLGAVVPMLVLGLFPHTVPLVVAMAVAGAGIEVFNLAWNLVMMEQVPADMLSRAFSYDMLGSFVAMPVGQLVYGSLGGRLGAADLFVASAVVYAIIVVTTLAVPAVRRLARDPGGPPVPETTSEGATA
jgi:MFS family permease